MGSGIAGRLTPDLRTARNRIGQHELGESATFDLFRWPNLLEGTGGDRNRILEHLVANELLAVERTGSKLTVRRGPVVERLRESFREQMLARAREQAKASRRSFGDEAAGWLADLKRSFGVQERLPEETPAA